MSMNIATYTPPGESVYSLRNPDIGVEVDGLPAPWLEVASITRGKGPKLNEARFRIAPTIAELCGRFEEMARIVRPGQRVVVFMMAASQPYLGSQIRWPLFQGIVRRGRASLAEQQEEVEIIACDEWTYRNSAVISGLRAVGPEDNAVLIGTNDVVFNPDGLPNGSASIWSINGRCYRIFDLNGSNATYWNYAWAIRYVIEEHLGRQQMLDETGWEGLQALTEGQILRDVDVTGLSPLRAIERLCDRAGLRFCVEEIPAGRHQHISQIRFYRLGTGRKIHLRHQKSGSALNLNQTNLWKCSVRSNTGSDSLRIIGRGDIKRFESTFELAPGWDPALEENDFERYSPATNDNFIEVQDVFRKWVLNEGGDYSEAPFNQGPAYDLSWVFGTAGYSPRRRRFWPCLSRKSSGNSFGYVLDISYNGGATWRPYPGAFDNLLDECGIYLNCTQFEADTWIAIVKGMLKFRITASIDSDELLTAEICDGPIHSARPVQTVVLNMGREFKYRKVHSDSIFYQANQEGIGTPDEANDFEELRSRLSDQLIQRRQSEYSGTAVLPWIQPDIQPGDVVKGIDGRDFSFISRNRRIPCQPQVSEVVFHFADRWDTEIEFGVG